MRNATLATALAGAIAIASLHNAQAVDIKAGDWTVSVGGIVNAYYTSVSCSGDAVGGLALGAQALGCGGQGQRTTIGNGLLPNGLVTSASTTNGDYDVKALIGIYNSTATDSAIGQNSVVDVRQAYFTFGNASMGTVKLGRDYGIFGANAILSDMTLLGAGAPVQATQRGRVALGHIGAGYSYLGNYGQMSYSTPKSASGMGFDVGVMSPVSDTPILSAPVYTSKSTPQVQAQLSMTAEGFKDWIGAKAQKFTSAKLKLGVSYGLSKNDDNTAGTRGLESNANLTVGAYYSLNSLITLVGEVGQTRSKAFNGASARLNGVALGGIIFF